MLSFFTKRKNIDQITDLLKVDTIDDSLYDRFISLSPLNVRVTRREESIDMLLAMLNNDL